MTDQNSLMAKLLDEKGQASVPQLEEIIEAKVVSASKNEVLLDIPGFSTGIVRGPELFDESGEYAELKIGDMVSATVMEIENENGQVELSFRQAGHRKAWDELVRLMREEEVVDAEIIDANKGGLIVRVGRVSGFLPVSQLTVEHYPRVEGGNKNKILEKLQSYMGDKFRVRVIDVDEKEDKMIVSEKAAKSEEQEKLISAYSVGDKVEGKVTGVVDFGAFIEFGDGLEGLVHISELAWQRIDDPRDFVKVNDPVKAQIISIDNGRISLSIRRLQKDPWVEVVKKYKIGDKVKGVVLKTNPFGAFVELDNDIHGLAHISELSNRKISSAQDVVEIGKEYEFQILTIEPKEHRLGLSLKAVTEPKVAEKSEEKNTDNTDKKDDATDKKESLDKLETKKEEVKEEEPKKEESKEEKEAASTEASAEKEEKKEEVAESK